MKKSLLLFIAIFAFVACQQKPTEGQQLLKQLNEENLSLIVSNADGVTTYTGHRVDDLLSLVLHSPEQLQGALVADKMIGAAAATLLILGDVKEVNTNVVTTNAMQMLFDANIPVFANEVVDMMYNRTGDGQCPMDATMSGVTDLHVALDSLCAFYDKIGVAY